MVAFACWPLWVTPCRLLEPSDLGSSCFFGVMVVWYGFLQCFMMFVVVL